MYKRWLYFSTPDAHLISLEAKNGKVRWDVEVGDTKKGYWTTMAPLVVRDHAILGVGGDLDNIGAYMQSIDPETGKTGPMGNFGTKKYLDKRPSRVFDLIQLRMDS